MNWTRMRTRMRSLAFWPWVLLSPAVAFAVSATLTVDAERPGIQLSSNLFGVFFEEINSAGDGGLYAELIRNRSFEDSTNAIPYWTLITTGSAVGQMSLDRSFPVSATNAQSLRLTFQSGVGSVGTANGGYWGIPAAQGANYALSFYARGSAGPSIAAALEDSNGTTVYAEASVNGLTTNWQRFKVSLVPNHSDPAARLRLSVSQTGTVWIDFVSLFPESTFNRRTNGLRPDLANMLVELKPSFVRFPGGSWVDGMSLANAYHWEPTVGDPANRPERANLWGYIVSNGLGYHEYLQMCEDLGAQPLFVINCGMDVNQNAVPLSQMAPWVQEGLDAVQYANGGTNTYWGAQRAANGHPAPFNLQYMEIGNENGGSSYNDRYALFYDAIKSQYPQMHLIADVWGGIPISRPVEIMDEHYYSNPAFFINNANRYDAYDRSGPKVYVGEYAVTSGSGNGNLAGALAEAAFMTGLERNADVVAMASYAPLFANLSNKDWNPDLIYFTSDQVYGTPSYYVQQMFSQNRGDLVLPLSLTVTGNTGPPPHGAIGLGSWNTQVEYTNVVATSNGAAFFQSDFTSGAAGWRVYNGTWSESGGVYQQTAITTDCRSTTGDTNWSNYTITLRARKTGGAEGFLILFNWLDDNNWTWWNIGGWNNTQDAIEQMVNGTKSILGSAVPGPVQTGRWYDIRVVLSGSRIQCYLDGQLIHDVSYGSTPTLLASATYASSRGQIILKAVNVSSQPISTQLALNAARALAPFATATLLSSAAPSDENSLSEPAKVYPVTSAINGVSTNFNYTFPANSLSVVRFQALPDSPVGIGFAVTNQQNLAGLSNGVVVQLSSFITNAVSVNYVVECPAGFLASGTLVLAPGELAKTLPLVLTNLGNCSLIRLTLSDPTGGQLLGAPRAYLVRSLNGATDPPVLAWARFSDESVLYWSDTAANLMAGPSAAGPWTVVSNGLSPFPLTTPALQEFFRLKK